MFGFSDLGKTSHRLDMLSTYEGGDNPAVVTVVKNGDRRYERFFYVADGTASFELSDKTTVEAPAGTVVYLPFDSPYKCTWDLNGGCSYICLNFIIFDRDNNIINLSDKICAVLYDGNGKYFKLFRDFNKEWISSADSNLTAIMRFYEIICETKKDLDLPSGIPVHNMHTIISHINENYTENIPVEDLARMAGMGMTAFRKEFKNATGTSAVKYRNELRLKKAMEMLKTTEYNVCEISELLGFSDIYYFSKLFKRYYSMPPLAVKKERKI